MVGLCTLDQRLDERVVVPTGECAVAQIPVAKRSRLVASFMRPRPPDGADGVRSNQELPFSVRFAVAVAVMSGIVACRQFIPSLIGQ